jgi:hypothetical protein
MDTSTGNNPVTEASPALQANEMATGRRNRRTGIQAGLRSRRSDRRSRRDSSRLMLDLLRALAEAESQNLQQSEPLLYPALPPETTASGSALEDPDASGTGLPTSPIEPEPSPPPYSPATHCSPGVILLRSQMEPEVDEHELTCEYCGRVFRLQEGGASFEGKAACNCCEQRLNCDVVLPTLSRHRPHLYQVCDLGTGPENAKRPAWTNERRRPRPVPVAVESTGNDEDD